jgi:hypothetical protein
MAINHVFTNAVADATGTLTIWNGATTATVAATNIVRPSDWNSAHVLASTISGNTAGQSTVSGNDIVLAGGNNITLSANGSTISIVGGAGAGAVVSNAIQSVGSATNSGTNTSRFAADDHVHAGVFSVGVSTAGNTLGDTRVDVGRFVFQGGPNITLSQITAANALNTIVVSGGAGAAGNTGYLSAGTTNASLGTVSFADSNGVSWGVNGQTITATVKTDYLTSQSNQAVSAANGSYAFQTLSFSNANGISFGTSAGSAITASYTVPAPQTGISGIQVSDTTYTSGTVTFRNANGISFGSSGANGISASYTVPTQTVDTAGVYALGNTTGQSSSSTYDLRTLSVEGAGIVSVGWSNSSLRISATQSNQAASASNGSFTFQTLNFSNANNVTFGTSAGGIVSASVAAQTNQSGGIYALGNTTGQSSSSTYDARTLSIEGAGFISVGWSNGSFRISGTQTNPVVSNAILSVGSATGSGTNTSRFAADDHVHAGVFSVGVSNVGNTAGDTRVDVGRFVLAGGNNITLSQATAANALNTISIVGGAGGGGFTGGMSNIGNTAGTSGTVQSQMLVVGGPNITVSQSINGQSATLSISGNAPGAAAENNWVNLLGANTAGNTTASGSTLGFSGINLTLSGTNNSQVVFSAPATSSLVGTLGISLSTAGSTISVRLRPSSYFVQPPLMLNSVVQTVGASTSVVWPIELRDLEEIAFLQMVQTVSMSSMASIATAANNTKSYNQQGTSNFVLYTRGIGASSQSLQSVGSTSHSSRMSINVGQNANGSQWTVTHAFTFPAAGGTTSSSTSYATTLSNVNVSTTHLTAISGMKLAAFPFATTLEPNQYWIAHGVSTAATTDGNASLSNMRVTVSHWAMSQLNNTWGAFGSANNASIQALYGIGSYTTNGVTTASIGFSQISSTASHPVPYLTLARIA